MRILTFLLVFSVFLTIPIVADAALFSNNSSSSKRLTSITKLGNLSEYKDRKKIKKIMGVDPRRTPWCGYAVAWAVKKAGGTPPRSYPRAISWRNFGKKISLKNIKKGDIVIIRTRRGNHVTIFKSRSGNKFVGCGGNQSNRLKCSTYSIKSIRYIRR